MQTQGIFAQAYGKFEARIKIPLGRGIWPAFWMDGANGEIDIIETNSKLANEVHGAAHAPGVEHSASTTWNEPVSARYHTFGVVWTRTGITWTIDGHAYSRMAAYPGWTFNTPFFLILDVAVGGGWPGSPDATTRFPAYLTVDWIRVYRRVR
jgi:beta-glucanase (GH16 family)